MKPIEAGCLALVIAGRLIGREVHVIRLTDFPEDDEGKDWWEVELHRDFPQIGKGVPVIKEIEMVRIDGESFTEDKKLMEIEQ